MGCTPKQKHQQRASKECGWGHHKQRSAPSIPLPQLAKSREEQGEQDVEEQWCASMPLGLLSNSHAIIVADLHVSRASYWRLICSQSKMLALNRINEARLTPNGLAPSNPVTHTSDPALKMRAPRFPVRMTVATVLSDLPDL